MRVVAAHWFQRHSRMLYPHPFVDGFSFRSIVCDGYGELLPCHLTVLWARLEVLLCVLIQSFPQSLSFPPSSHLRLLSSHFLFLFLPSFLFSLYMYNLFLFPILYIFDSTPQAFISLYIPTRTSIVLFLEQFSVHWKALHPAVAEEAVVKDLNWFVLPCGNNVEPPKTSSPLGNQSILHKKYDSSIDITWYALQLRMMTSVCVVEGSL
ncbi:hypothetical protein EJ08DRAFT_724765 [Tothia fuscella]|uniref:Uncharacterized protein n=1 Tax=Tothia fuscella TaxID=1048955 RepID=A0A9P4TV27_9PEZI|nr:hypothetical protein EJ08DRAFT_724765 [Tothia fuscella]